MARGQMLAQSAPLSHRLDTWVVLAAIIVAVCAVVVSVPLSLLGYYPTMAGWTIPLLGAIFIAVGGAYFYWMNQLLLNRFARLFDRSLKSQELISSWYNSILKTDFAIKGLLRPLPSRLVLEDSTYKNVTDNIYDLVRDYTWSRSYLPELVASFQMLKAARNELPECENLANAICEFLELTLIVGTEAPAPPPPEGTPDTPTQEPDFFKLLFSSGRLPRERRVDLQRVAFLSGQTLQRTIRDLGVPAAPDKWKAYQTEDELIQKLADRVEEVSRWAGQVMTKLSSLQSYPLKTILYMPREPAEGSRPSPNTMGTDTNYGNVR